MEIDFLGSGILSYVLPVAVIIGAVIAIPQILRGRYNTLIALVVVGGGGLLGFHFYSQAQDTQALQSAVSQRYGLPLTDFQVGVLRENHSYRRYERDVTVDTKQGVAKPYGTISVTQHGAKRKVMMYEAHGKWFLGSLPAASASDQEVQELSVIDGGIPSVN